MPSIAMSHHANVRCAQRGIEPEIIDIVLHWGRQDYDHRGACRYFLGRPEKTQLLKHSPDALRKHGRKLDAVVVTGTDTGTVITVFVRKRRS